MGKLTCPYKKANVCLVGLAAGSRNKAYNMYVYDGQSSQLIVITIFVDYIANCIILTSEKVQYSSS